MKRHFLGIGVMGISLLIFLLASGCGSGSSSPKSRENPEPSNTILVGGHVDTGLAAENLAGQTGILVTAYRMEADQPLQKRLLKTSQITEGVYQTITDSAGNYELEIPPANYTIVAESPNHRNAMKSLSLTEENGSLVTLDFILTATGNITGRLLEDGNPLLTDNNLIYIPGTGYAAYTDGNGFFSLNDVPVGTYLLNLAGTLRSVSVPMEGTDIGTIDLALESPQVISTSPANGGTTSRFFNKYYYWEIAFSTIAIRFSDPMDEASLKEAVHVTAPGNIPIQWIVSLNYVNSRNELFVSPASPEEYDRLPVGQYTVTISTAALSRSGKPLDKEYTFSFVLEDRIVAVYPEDGSRNAAVETDPSSEIYPAKIVFSARMNHSSLNLNISPPVPGLNLQWSSFQQNGSRETLFLDGAFALDTAYTLTVTDGVTEAGNPLSGLPYTFTFTTLKPDVTGSTPVQGATEVRPENPVIIYFNTVMDRDQVEKGVSVQEGDTQVTSVKMRWEKWYGWTENEALRLDFPKSYGKRYTVSLSGGRTAQGTPVSDYAFDFTTLTPRILFTDPADQAIFPLRGPIKLYSNVPLSSSSINDSTIRMVDQDNQPVEVDLSLVPGYSTYTIQVYPLRLKSSTLYTVSTQGLQSIDGSPLQEKVIQFQTPRRFLAWDFPRRGDTNVQPDAHYVRVYINDPFTPAEKTAIESALVITARTYTDNEGINETHPTPLFLWSEGDNGSSQLWIDFTFDEGTNYRIWARDGNGNSTQEIRDADGNPVLTLDQVLEFSTRSSATGAAIEPNLVYEFSPRNGSIGLSPGNPLVRVIFGTVVSQAGLRINLYEDGILVPSGDYQVYLNWGYREVCEENRTCSYRYVSTADLSFVDPTKAIRVYNKSYRVEVIAATPNSSYAEYGGTTDNLPATASFSTAPPPLYLSVDNSRGAIRIETGNADILMDAGELPSALVTEPSVSCTWEMDATPFMAGATCYYAPIQYGNIRVNLDSLRAFSHHPETEAIADMGSFVNTPFSTLFYVTPDLIPPVLDKVDILENISTDHATLSLAFNTILDRDSVMAPGAITIRDGDGNPLPIRTIDAGSERWAGPTIVLTSDALITGIPYTVTIQGVREFGGHYTIDTTDSGTKTFLYNGTIEEVTAIMPLYDYDGNGVSQYVAKFAVHFSAPMMADNADYRISDHVTVEPDCYCSTAFSLVIYAWNSTADTLVITGVYAENAGITNAYHVTVDGFALNISGNPLDNTPYVNNYVYTYNSATLQTAWPGVTATTNTQIQIPLYSWSAVDSSALNPSNYTLQPDTGGNPLGITGASLNADGTIITLDLDPTTPLTGGTTYNLTISNVRKISLNFPAEFLGPVYQTSFYRP